MKTGWLGLALLCFVWAVTATKEASAQIVATEDQCAEAWNEVESAGQSVVALQEFTDSYSTCPQVAFAELLLVGKGGAVALGGDRRGWGPSNGGSAITVQRQPVGVLASPNDRLSPVNGGYALILMRRGGAGNDAACRVFTRYLGFSAEPVSTGPVLIGNTAVYQLPVYWPTRRLGGGLSASDCPQMLSDYDYIKASTYLDHPPVAPFTRGGGPYIAIVHGDGKQIGLFDFAGLGNASARRQLEGALSALTKGDALEKNFYEEPSLLQRLVGWMDGSNRLEFKATLINLTN
jgi:hypothetical protein